MVLLPYERVSVRSAVPLAELQRKLADSVEPRKWRWPWQTKHRAFEGRVEGTRFKINCVIHYRNSFLPVIEGELRENSDGVTLHAILRLHRFVAVFMTLWIGGVLTGAIAFLLGRGNDPRALVAVPFGMALFGYGLTMGAFKTEARRARRLLEELCA